MKWSNFSYNDAQKIIKKLDLKRTPANSHDEVYWYYLDGKRELRIILPNNHAGTLSPGFIGNIKKNLKLETRQFERLVDCHLSADGFAAHVRDLLAD